MKTIMYLLRHGATAANLEKPAKLQGRGVDHPLSSLGIRQAELTRDCLALNDFAACYTSPMQRAIKTAQIIVKPHGLRPHVVKKLTECDVGSWEGKSWEEIAEEYPQEYKLFMQDPAKNGYRGGESFADVHKRTGKALDDLFQKHKGRSFIVVAHHVVNRIYLADLMGMPPSQARRISLDNCGISIIVRDEEKTKVQTLNSSFHLIGALAA